MRHGDQPSDQDQDLDGEPVHNDTRESVRVPDPREAPTSGTVIGVAPEHQGAATAAVTSDAALVAEEQDARAVNREADPVARYVATLLPEVDAAVGTKSTEEVLADAEERDARAELRDRLAEEREQAASLRSFLGDRTSTASDRQSAELLARRAAALDRLDAKADRAAAASDRARLSAQPSPGSSDGGVASASYMSEFAAELSHDLRVPLSSIIASVEMLQDDLAGHCGPDAAAHMARALRAGARMVRMLDQNMTSGKPATTPEVDLAEVVRQVVLDSADLLEPVGAVVEAEELPVVRADADDMYSVLQNLITNSVKFAREGVPAVVRISASRRLVDGWRISVRDNGVGLPDSSKVHVFALFSRGTDEVPGHGIGLATVARIIAAHGGRVGTTPAESGAEIWFELP